MEKEEATLSAVRATTAVMVLTEVMKGHKGALQKLEAQVFVLEGRVKTLEAGVNKSCPPIFTR